VNLDTEKLLTAASLQKGDFVINCVGLTKSRIDESSIASRSLAIKLNVDFPNDLAKAAEKLGFKIIQVATDCVFSGLAGGYSEGSAHDALDVYGKTKSLGETPSPNVMHLRCSLIGPEVGRSSLFFEWVRQQPINAQIDGYTNHLWNGLSSRAFGKVVSGIVSEDLFESSVQHLVPSDKVTKDELVRLELSALGRDDVQVTPKEDGHPIDRTLATDRIGFNTQLFLAAGYKRIPSIKEMVLEACMNLPN
jgi:dTDP-4-dehydrorhamnose reductase